jgi:hypothetical protein
LDARHADAATLRAAWPDSEIIAAVPAVDPAAIAEPAGIARVLQWVGTDDDLPAHVGEAAERLQDRGYGG